MATPIIQIRQVDGRSTYLTLTEFDIIMEPVTFKRPDPYTYEFLGTWPGHRFAIIEAASDRLIRFIAFFPMWNDANQSLELTVKAVNLDGTDGVKEQHRLDKQGKTFTFKTPTEPGLSYTITRIA